MQTDTDIATRVFILVKLEVLVKTPVTRQRQALPARSASAPERAFICLFI
jgi:hypothetical protein